MLSLSSVSEVSVLSVEARVWWPGSPGRGAIIGSAQGKNTARQDRPRELLPLTKPHPPQVYNLLYLKPESMSVLAH